MKKTFKPILGTVSTLNIEKATIEELDGDYREGGICAYWIDKKIIGIKIDDEFSNEMNIILSNKDAIRLRNELSDAIESSDRHNWDEETK